MQSPVHFKVINVISIFAFAIFLFILFTNAIPLMSWGFIPDLGLLKGPYKKIFNINLIVFALLSLTAYFSLKEKFWCLKPAQWMKRFFEINPFKLAVLFFIVYGAALSSLGIIRHHVLATRACDLGIFAQAVWNTLQGDFLFSSIKNHICLLGDHMSPFLLFLVLFYAIIPDPTTLLIVQAVCAALFFFPLKALCEDKIPERFWSIVFLTIAFFYFPTRAALHEDFHPEVLIEPLLLAAFLFLEKGWMKRFWITIPVILAAKENMHGVCFALGLYAAFIKKKPVHGGLLAFLSLGLFFTTLKVFMPKLAGTAYVYADNYSFLKQGIAAISEIFSDGRRWNYFAKVYGAFCFLPFFHPATAFLTLPVFLQNLLSQNTLMRSFNYHYFAGLTSFLFASSICALQQLLQKPFFKRYQYWMGMIMLVVAIKLSSPAEYYYFWSNLKHRPVAVEEKRRLLNNIPSRYSVLTYDTLAAQAVNRKYLYMIGPEYQIRPSSHARQRQVDIVALDKTMDSRIHLPDEDLDQEMSQAGYSLEAFKDTLRIYRKSSLPPFS